MNEKVTQWGNWFCAEFEQKLLVNVIDAAVQEIAQFEEKLRCSSPVAEFTYAVIKVRRIPRRGLMLKLERALID